MNHPRSKDMQFIVVLRAMWYALVAPQRIADTCTASATAFFAVAVVVSTAFTLGSAYLENADPALRAENDAIARLAERQTTTSSTARHADARDSVEGTSATPSTRHANASDSIGGTSLNSAARHANARDSIDGTSLNSAERHANASDSLGGTSVNSAARHANTPKTMGSNADTMQLHGHAASAAGDATHPDTKVDMSTPGRAFTAILGGALIKTMAPLAALAAIFLVAARFMMNATISFGQTIRIVAATTSILDLEIVINTVLHLLVKTGRAGLHAGVFVDPAQHNFLFFFLQNLSPIMAWRFIVIAMAIAQTAQMHRRFGYVVGPVVWLVVLAALGLLSFTGMLFYGM